MNKKKRRAETRKNQREAEQHFHPRWLARAIAHNVLANEGASGVNKCAPGTTQSPFSKSWRQIAERYSANI